MIAIGQHITKHLGDVQEIAARVKAIASDWTPPAPGNIVALDEAESQIMSAMEADATANGWLDDFQKNRPLLSAIIKLLLGALPGLIGG